MQEVWDGYCAKCSASPAIGTAIAVCEEWPCTFVCSRCVRDYADDPGVSYNLRLPALGTVQRAAAAKALEGVTDNGEEEACTNELSQPSPPYTWNGVARFGSESPGGGDLGEEAE